MLPNPQPTQPDYSKAGELAVAVILTSGTIATGIMAGFFPQFYNIFVALLAFNGPVVGHYFGFQRSQSLMRQMQQVR